MGDLYSRVYMLPERLDKARAKVAKAKRTIWSLGDNVRKADRDKLEVAERRLRPLENEARQYNFFDLLKSD